MFSPTSSLHINGKYDGSPGSACVCFVVFEFANKTFHQSRRPIVRRIETAGFSAKLQLVIPPALCDHLIFVLIQSNSQYSSHFHVFCFWTK